MPKELPWSKWVWADWLDDFELQLCSKAAKGCWADMLAHLDKCPVRGVFCTASGDPLSDEQISDKIGGDRAENLRCIAELIEKGAASRNKRGAVFSRRMVREEEERAANRGYVQKHRDKKKGECKEVVSPNLLSLNSKESKPTAFLTENFDGSEQFELLCQSYSKAERSPIAAQRFFEAVEWLVEHRKMTRTGASALIREKAKLYCQREKFQKGLTRWLDEKVFLQDDKTWGKAGPVAVQTTPPGSASAEMKRQLMEE